MLIPQCQKVPFSKCMLMGSRWKNCILTEERAGKHVHIISVPLCLMPHVGSSMDFLIKMADVGSFSSLFLALPMIPWVAYDILWWSSSCIIVWFIVVHVIMGSDRFCVQEDRTESNRKCKIGKIEVIRYKATFIRREMRPPSEVDFTQANKKDVKEVTRSEYCMTTTRQGKVIRNEKPYSRMRSKSIWNIGDKQDKLGIEYHMTQTLLDWGIQPVQPNWSRPGSSATLTSASVKTE